MSSGGQNKIKFTEIQILDIVSSFKNGETRVSLAKRFNCKSRDPIDRILNEYIKFEPKPFPKIEGEEWKDIAGFEGLYQVSNKGRVKSLDRSVNHPTNGKITLKGELMDQGVRNRYYSVGLTKNGFALMRTIHRLVANAFIANPNNYPVVNHLDFDRTNNNVENLQWCTHAENTQHFLKEKYKIGSRCKVNEEDVALIRKRVDLPTKELAKILNVSSSTINKIRRVENYKNLG